MNTRSEHQNVDLSNECMTKDFLKDFHHGYSVWRTISYLIVVGSRTNMKVGLVLNDEEFLLPNVWEVPWGTC